MSNFAAPLRRAATQVFRIAAARRAALRAAAARGRSLVLLYHRVAPGGPAAHEVVPSLSTTLFRQQLEALGEVGDIVPLVQVLDRPGPGQRVRFAITFDDDECSHVEHALPVLQALGIHATFFLSGRSLSALGPYWWTLLEQMIADGGMEEARRTLGIDGATPARLAAICEGSPFAERLSALVTPRRACLPGIDDVRTLVSAGMAIGFHTLRHPVLTSLPREALQSALRDGRQALAAAIGKPVDLFAYPHGRADQRVARQVRSAAYRAAFRTGGCPVHPHGDPFLLGRWEPGPLTADELLAHVALRLNHPIAGPPR